MVLRELAAGYRIRGEWEIVRKLGSGNFGAVYMAEGRGGAREGKAAAVKVETRGGAEGLAEDESVLCLEVKVIRLYSGELHAARFLGCGMEGDFYWLAMELLGSSLQDLKRRCKDGRLSKSSGIRMLEQGVEALDQLHSRTGFVHRDLKPANLVLGREEEEVGRSRILCLIDFGLSRRFRTKDGNGIRRPRSSVPFRGSIRYAAPNAHAGNEVSRGDDMVSLFYVALDLMGVRLPWVGEQGRQLVGRIKEQTPARDLLAGFPQALHAYPEKLRGLGYAAVPDYAALRQACRASLTALGVAAEDPFDWERRGFFRSIRNSFRGSVRSQTSVSQSAPPVPPAPAQPPSNP